jgi:hypothetical protein
MKGRSTEEPQGGLPRNYLRASLLLLIAETPAHGYDLLEQIAQLGLRNVDPAGRPGCLVVGALHRRPGPPQLPPHRRGRRVAPRLGRRTA